MRALRELFRGRASFSGRFFSFEDVEIEPAAGAAGRAAALGRRPLAGGDPARGGARRRLDPDLGLGRALRGGARASCRSTSCRRSTLPAHVGDKRRARTSTCAQRYAGEFTEHVVDRYCVAGTPEECAARVREYVDAGAQHIVFNIAAIPRTRERLGGGRRLLPLADVRVIAIEQFGAGPWGTLQLADLGAEVIKIEDPSSGGDVGRYVPPFQEGEDSLFFETFNRNKKSVSLDLRHPRRASRASRTSSASADVVYSNLRGDQPAKLGLTYDELKDVNPRIVCCSLSGFGMTGPRAAEGGYDYMMQGLAGWMSLTGDPDGPPTKSGLSLVDLSGGYVSTIAVLAGALARAARRRRLRLRRLAVRDGAARADATSAPGRRRAATCRRAGATRRTRRSCRSRTSPTADGWIVVACPKEKFWERALRRDRAARARDDERFADFAARDREPRRAACRSSRTSSAARTSAEWLAAARRGRRAARAGQRRRCDAVEDARGSSRTSIRSSARCVRSPRPSALGAEPPARPAPLRGEHTESVLVELCGYPAERLQELAAAGVFGEPTKGATNAEAGVST